MRAERDVVVGEVRRRGWVKVGFGLYRRDLDGDNGSVDGDTELRADLVAWQQVLPPSGCLTHLTGAVLHDLWIPPLPAGLPVFVSQAKTETRPKRPEVRAMRHTRPIEARWHQGVRLAAVHEVLLACARDLSLLDLVVLGDSALAAGLTTTEELRLSASRRRWGAATLQNTVG